MEPAKSTSSESLGSRISGLSPAKRALLEKALFGTPTPSASAIPHTADRTSGPLSFAQQRLWFLHRFDASGDAHHMAWALRLRGPLDERALEQALRETTLRHESLRTHFVEANGALAQVVGPPPATILRVEDLTKGSAKAPADDLTGILSREMAQPFNLSQGPLLRTILLRLGKDEYVFLLNAHELAFDDWSVGVFERELSALYEASRQGRSNPLPPLSIQYRDYAVWQRERLQGETLKRLLTYWTQKLEGAPPLLAIPTDRPRSPASCQPAGSRTLDLSTGLAVSLSVMCGREDVTLFTALLAAFKVLLARCSGQEEIVMGTPRAGRSRSELEGLIGCFGNTLVLRTDLSGNPTFKELLRRVRSTVDEAFDHEDLPFEKLIEALHLEPDMNLTPLVQVLYTMSPPPGVPVLLAGLDVERMSLPGPCKFDLTLHATEIQDQIRLRIDYRTELFKSETVERLLAQYRQLLEQIATAPEKPIHQYSLVTASAHAQLPDPTLPLSLRSHPSVVQQVLKWAESTPESVAVSTGGRGWTYAQVADRARSVSNCLREMGVGRGDVVAIVSPRGFGLVATMLGVFMSGGAFLTIDSMLPAHRQQLMLREARAKVLCLIDQPDDAGLCLDGDRAITVLRADADLSLLPKPAQNSDRVWSLPMTDANDPAYVFFTSGSTGRPKAVLSCHSGLNHFLEWQRNTFKIGEEDRVSQLIGLSFDPLLRDIFLPLTSGATLCIPTESDLLDTIRWMRHERITVAHTTPTLIQSWLLENEHQVALECLRWVFISGEPITDVLIDNWRRKISGPARWVNFYGSTETPMARCYHVIPDEVEPGAQPVGTALPECQALVLNAAGLLCGIGETGEIALRTRYQSLGYLNLPEENQRRFRPNPFRNDASDIVYFMGDRGRYRADGLLEIAGRADDQVKIRGIRVEPGEVTATLARYPAIRNCIVIARPNEQGQKHLVGYVVLKPEQLATASELRSYLTDLLTRPFVPSAFVFLDALPTLPNGKVDRRALPAPESGRANLDAPYVPPRDGLEEVVAGVWREVLKVERVGVHDNFFELGGHSLIAVQLVARLSKLVKVEVPLRRLFETATVSALTAELQNMLAPKNAASNEAVSIRPQGEGSL
jgi:amino acid adenylation domain-containing protein